MAIRPIAQINYENKTKKSDSTKRDFAQGNAASVVDKKTFPSKYPQIGYKPISFKGVPTQGLFKAVGAFETSPLWGKLIGRETDLYRQVDDLRSEFTRDYDRILHSDAYNRLSGKTQVFSHPKSDTTSKRIHHVNQVASIAEDLAKFFGLNTELTRAIAIGHDVGHTPFGHGGERALAAIMKANDFDDVFWHEKNSLRFVTDIETKLDPKGYEENLNLTYGVRDGIALHCGEVDENGLRPRTEFLDLGTLKKSNRPQPFTWEGCVVKLADKIAYLGKDLEDAINNRFLKPEKIQELIETVRINTGLHFNTINNTVLINHFLADLRRNSSAQKGLCFTEPTYKLMNSTKKFNYDNIYLPKDNIQGEYYNLTINTVFKTLSGLYDGKKTLIRLYELKDTKPTLIPDFINWLIKYSNIAPDLRAQRKYSNKIIYDIEKEKDYKLAIIEYIASLTDRALTKAFDEIIFFG